MDVFDAMGAMGHEHVAFYRDEPSGYHGIIAVHSTRRGPAVGGTRYWHYETSADALTDVLRLSRGMTYKNAAAGLPFGGGKAVILLAGEAIDRRALFRAHGRFVDRFGGRFITAEDVCTSAADMDIVGLETPHVAGLSSGAGDPSPYTALGVFCAIQAAVMDRWGTTAIAGRTVALQGCGNVGHGLARELHKAGARLIVADINPVRAARTAAECGGTQVTSEQIVDVAADIFAPCALGGVLNDDTIPRLRVEVVAGGANNQLLEPRHGDMLAARGILYAPDYVANAGGVISGCMDLLGWSKDRALEQVRAIHDTMLHVFEIAKTKGVPPHVAADRLAEQRLAEGGADESRIPMP